VKECNNSVSCQNKVTASRRGSEMLPELRLCLIPFSYFWQAKTNLERIPPS
jgi:hypothetical protein